jgi:diguanylate cyclase (GGDEF)-like protein
VSTVNDMHSEAAAERLLEESWETRSRGVSARELVTEVAAGGLFLVAAGSLLLLAGATNGFDPVVAAVLVALYALVSRVEFPVGAGYVVPSQLVLVPMLVLLPPATVPLLVACGLLLARLSDWCRHRGSALRVLFSIADAWHAFGPAVVLLIAGSPQIGLDQLPLLGAALLSCFAFDAGSAMVREAAARGIAPHLQLQVLALVWVVDGCLAPIGFLAAHAGSHALGAVLLVVPLAGLLALLGRDRDARIEQAQSRLQLAIRERSRLQTAVRRLGDAFAAKLDLDALVDILLRGSIEALDADAGRLAVSATPLRCVPDETPADLREALRDAAFAAGATSLPEQVHRDGTYSIGLPFGIDGQAGAVALARRSRAFQEDEITLLSELVAKGRTAADEILGHHALREQAISDPLTGLGNRRKLAERLGAWSAQNGSPAPRLLMLFDLDGFKRYNDTFGHPAGDALLAHIAAKLAAVAAPYGDAYRLGGDEFCAVLAVDEDRREAVVAAAAQALTMTGDGFSITASYGVVHLPHEADTLERALQLADERMYSHKRVRTAR